MDVVGGATVVRGHEQGNHDEAAPAGQLQGLPVPYTQVPAPRMCQGWVFCGVCLVP
jgi:hypothetical protein